MNIKKKLLLLLAAVMLMSSLIACGGDDECGMCNGTGYYEKKTCPACGGSGHSDYDPYEQMDNIYGN